MPFDFTKFCEDNNIPTAPNGHKHTRQGWINVECGSCSGNTGYHLGYNQKEGYFSCFRCGFQGDLQVIKSFLKCSTQGAKATLAQYKGKAKGPVPRRLRKKYGVSTCHLPEHTDRMNKKHRDYLRSRKFNPYELERTWDLRGTMRNSFVKVGSEVKWYKFRVIIPIYFEMKLCSWQGRDITNKSTAKYKTCPKELEARNLKKCLYGYDMVDGDSCVVVEGAADAWRLGRGAVCTFGIDWSPAQAILLQKFRQVYIAFDAADKQAMKQADSLAYQIQSPETNAEVIELEEADPAELTQRKADKLMNKLIRS